MDFCSVRPFSWPLGLLLCVVAVSGAELYFDKAYLEYDIKEAFTAEDNEITVSFRTVEPMGLLLHASSTGGSASDYVTLELIGGKLRYAARLGGNDGIFDGHELYLGDNLADGGPHTVKVERKGKVVTVTLDPEIRNPIIREEKGMYANLDLDQYIFTGGSTGLSSLHGVDSNSNFMGCIMESKFSYKTPSGDTEEIDLLVQSKQVPANMPACPKNQEYQPVSFPGGGSRLTIDTGKDSKMIGSFKFRTYKSEGVLLKQKNFEISYRLKSVTLEVQSSPVTVSPSKLINQGNWFTVEFEVSAQSLKLTVDGQPSNLNGKPMDGNFFDSDTVFGTDFIGCMRDIVINSAKIDPKNAPTSDRPKVVDKCIIHDFCHPNPCQNDGTCKQDGVTFDCQCVPDSGYEGAICQLPVYPMSCAKIKEKNREAKDGNHTIDVDGPGPLKPFKAYCLFDEEIWQKSVTKIWSLDKNQEVVRYPAKAGEAPESFVRTVKYYPSFEAARALARNSNNCSQLIEYGCRQSPLLNNGDPFYGRWVSVDGVFMSYWGGADPKSKACGCYPNCLDHTKTCNCDALKDSWEKDRGNITDYKMLPVSQVLFGGVNEDKDKEGNFTVGDLVCTGKPGNIATFINQDGMLRLASWTPPSHGDLSLQFRTPYATGVLFSNGDLKKEYVQLHIVNSTTMALNFDIGSGTKSIFVTIKGQLNDRKWHKVFIYRNLKEFTMQVDEEEERLALDLSSMRDLNVDGDLYLGSDPKAQNGFVGCIRGLTVNGNVRDIETEANEEAAGSAVTGGCGYACKDNTHCMNGATCLDNYDVYECNCTVVPFYGYFCHEDHGAYFDTESYMTYTYPSIESFPGVDITIGFKTQKCQGDMLRITSKDSDEYFLLGFRKDELKLIFNTAIETSHTIAGAGACDNERHTFAMTRMNKRIAYRFDQGEWQWKDVHNLNKPFPSMYQVIVGSQDESFQGCLTGVKVTQHPTDKPRAAIQPIEAYLYYKDASSEVQSQKKHITVANLSPISRLKCGYVPEDVPPIPTPRIPRPGTQAPVAATTSPHDDEGEGSNTAVIVIVVLILILVIVAVLVAIYYYWSRHKGVYHTHEDDENIKSTDPYIDLVPANNKSAEAVDGDTEKKKEWYI